jgi:hypothetical protein
MERLMSKPLLGGLLAATILTAPLLAQAAPQAARDPATEMARGYATVPSPAEPAVDAREAPVTAALNAQAGADASQQQAISSAQAADHAAAMSQYDQDRDAYMAALIQHDARIDRTDARYARQQRAYADAMAVWRVQAAECQKGKQRACKAPPPSVADYY